MEKEKGEVILNEDYNNKQKERVRRDFKDKIHHHGMKKEDARESLRFGQIFTRVTFIWVILNMTMYGLYHDHITQVACSKMSDDQIKEMN